jgi:hypothetical protein
MNARMKKGVFVSVVVVAILVMSPLTALACHVETYSGAASCQGFELQAEVVGTVTLYWKVKLERWDANLNDWVVEDEQTNGYDGESVMGAWTFPSDPPANPGDGQWRDDLPDGEYRAILRMWASDGSSWEDTVLGITFPCSPPTAVTLASFGAAAAGGAIVLNWETAAELNSVGFNVYRAASADGLRSRLNGSLIASQAPGSPTGASYQFTDDTARAGMTYYYWLHEVDANGGMDEYGPVSAQLEARARLRLVRPRLAANAAYSMVGR